MTGRPQLVMSGESCATAGRVVPATPTARQRSEEKKLEAADDFAGQLRTVASDGRNLEMLILRLNDEMRPLSWIAGVPNSEIHYTPVCGKTGRRSLGFLRPKPGVLISPGFQERAQDWLRLA